jgi:hypothetical protein
MSDPGAAAGSSAESASPSGDAPRQYEPPFEFAAELDAFVAAGEGTKLLEAFAANLVRIDQNTWENLYRAVDLLVGYGTLRELIWALRARPSEVRADFEREGLSAEAQDLLLRILVQYGGRIQEAYGQSPLSSYPDDWDLINPEVLVNVKDGELEVSTYMRKKNGDTMVIRGGSSSFMRWLVLMHEALQVAGDRKWFESDDVERLLRQLDASRALLAGGIEDQAEAGEQS